MSLGLTSCVSRPPEYTFHSSPKIAFPKPSTIWLRQEFPVQINGFFGHDKPLYL